MPRHVIILSTVINTPIDLQHINQVVATFSEISDWSVDLEDCDQILRVVCAKDLGSELVESLECIGVKALLMEVFDENGIPCLK